MSLKHVKQGRQRLQVSCTCWSNRMSRGFHVDQSTQKLMGRKQPADGFRYNMNVSTAGAGSVAAES